MTTVVVGEGTIVVVGMVVELDGIVVELDGTVVVVVVEGAGIGFPENKLLKESRGILIPL
jgi:hypothetical protein